MKPENIEKIKVIIEDEEREAKVVDYLELKGKEYLLYSVDDDEVLASLVVEKDDEIELHDITDEEMKQIEKIMEEEV